MQRFTEAIQLGFDNYANFKGRAARYEYWYWTLFSILLNIGIQILAGLLAAIGLGLVGGIVMLVVSLGMIIPGLSVSIRRLHDIGKSGWWFLIYFIPLVGLIFWLIWMCKKSDEDYNNYGENPLKERGLI